MRTVFVLFDTLNRRSLECYGGISVKTPNFNRLARRTVMFDNHYVGSLPCMPARREIMTGRHNFLHRSWGPLEPFDHAFPEILGEQSDTYTHLVTDHAHYWEDGGATYHTRYDSAEMIRGQENDAWKGIVEPDAEAWRAKYHPRQFNMARRHKFRRNMTNRVFYPNYEDYPAVKTFNAGLEFLETNRTAKNWFLQIETFDPHEPFDIPAKFREDYKTNYRGPLFDFPTYGPVTETPDEVAEMRANYAATLAHCDLQLGRLLDFFDRNDLWRDTALIVSTDHGFLLGEQDVWGKVMVPVFNEVAHIPLFVHHPDFVSGRGTRRTALTQTIDLMPTFLDIYGIAPPAEVQGRSLLPLLANPSAPSRTVALYGQHGAAINVTDGRYTYFRYPKDMHGGNLNQYTLMPTHIQSRFGVDELKDATLAEPFDFTQGLKLLKVPSTEKSSVYNRQGAGVQIMCETRLFDLAADPGQLKPIDDAAVEMRLVEAMTRLMIDTDAPVEAYVRFGLNDLYAKTGVALRPTRG